MSELKPTDEQRAWAVRAQRSLSEPQRARADALQQRVDRLEQALTSRAESVADERRRIGLRLTRQLSDEAEGGDDDPLSHAYNAGVRAALSLVYAACDVPLADRAGSE